VVIPYIDILSHCQHRLFGDAAENIRILLPQYSIRRCRNKWTSTNSWQHLRTLAEYFRLS